MTIQHKEVEYCKIQVNFQATPEIVSEKREEILNNLKKSNIRVPGWRQQPVKSKNGSVRDTKSKRNKRKPLSTGKKYRELKDFERALKIHYHQQIESSLINELVAEGYDEAIFETKMKPIGYPNVSNTWLDGNNFSCEMLFLKKPDFELKQYKEFEIPSSPSEDSVVEVERALQELREQYGDVVPYDENDFAQEGDSVTMDISTTVDSQQISELTKIGLFYTIGQNTNQEFDSNLYGMKAGDSRVFEIKFGQDENINPILRNKTVRFDVTLHMGTKKVPAPLNDELAKKVGTNNFEELRSQVEGAVANRIQVRHNLRQVNQIVNRLLELHTFEVPNWLVLPESQRAAAQMGQKWEELTDEEILALNERSKKEIRLSLILDSIRGNEPEAVFSEKELVNQLYLNLKNQGYDKPEQLLNVMQKDGSLIGHVARLRDEATIQWIISTCKIIGND